MLPNENNIKDYLINYCSYGETHCARISNIIIKHNTIDYTRHFYNIKFGWDESVTEHLSIKFFNRYLLDVRKNKILKLKECLK